MAPSIDELSQGSGDWAQLPDNLLDDISRRLPLLSAIAMGRVCKPWRRILAEVTRRQGLPWLLLTGHNQCEERPCLSILQKNFWSLQVPDGLGKYCWGSVHDWLIIVNKLASTLQIHLWNPFSRTKLDLPNVADRYSKLILSAYPDDPNCLFLLFGIYDKSIACWTRGVKTWRVDDDDWGTPVALQDAVYCEGRFYFLFYDYNVQTLDAKTLLLAMKQDQDCCTGDIQLHLQPHQVKIPEYPIWPSNPMCSYLVESCGEVLMVCRLFIHITGGTDCGDTYSFEVFKLDEHQMMWSKMQGLGDRVLFIGKSDTRSFSTKDLGDDVANHIFFFNDYFSSGVNEWDKAILDTTTQPFWRSTFMDWGSFNMDTKCFLPSGSNRISRQNFSPIWITAPIWWFFTIFSTNKHQCVNIAKRTAQPVKNKKSPVGRRKGGEWAIDHRCH